MQLVPWLSGGKQICTVIPLLDSRRFCQPFAPTGLTRAVSLGAFRSADPDAKTDFLSKLFAEADLSDFLL